MALKLTIGWLGFFFFSPGLTNTFYLTSYKRSSSSLPPGNVRRSRFGPTMADMDCCDLLHTFKNNRHVNGPTNRPSGWGDLFSISS